MKRSYSTAFIALDAAQTGQAAVDTMLATHASPLTHVIVQRVEHGAIYFYLFEFGTLLRRLVGQPAKERGRSTLKKLLDLHEPDQSPIVAEHDEPVGGAVVVRDGEALGFVPLDGAVSLAPTTPASALDDVLAQVFKGGDGSHADSRGVPDLWRLPSSR